MNPWAFSYARLEPYFRGRFKSRRPLAHLYYRLAAIKLKKYFKKARKLSHLIPKTERIAWL
jgi:hypothetical protein